MAKRLKLAQEVIQQEADTLRDLVGRLDEKALSAAVDLIISAKGRVVVSGMGKAGIIGQKISATLASTGTPSLYLHPAEAVHGDLGRLMKEDVLLILSNSGQTEEVIRLLDPIKELGAPIVAMTGNPDSQLARNADASLIYGSVAEVGQGFAPTASTTAMLALGDALSMVIQKERNFSPEEMIRFHPGGFLGRTLLKVKEIMRSGDRNPVVSDDAKVKDVVIVMTTTPGRPGAASVVDQTGKLTGFFTDGDLRRHLLEGTDSFMSLSVAEVMTQNPKAINHLDLVSEAHQKLRDNRIDQIPVIDDQNKPVGLLDVQDILDFKSSK